ncbi:MAG: aminotransferase class V-fold PLP-dependent enzyme [Pseudomonadota bacterium]
MNKLSNVDRALPEHGTPWIDLQHELNASRADDLDWTHGALYYHWPEPGGNVHQAAMAAGNIFFTDIWLGRFSQPSVNKLSSEIEGFVLDLHDAPADGHVTLTSGGTESILLCMKAARDWARQERPKITRPKVVAPFSAHPAFSRSAFYFGLDLVRVPVGPDLRADPKAMEQAITDDTIALIGSAPSWPYGLIDPIPEIGALAEKYGLWCHVDACIGGFLIPFYRALGDDLTAMNFLVPGVTSISADLHKFGFTPHGISSATFRSHDHARHGLFEMSDWPCGRYAAETVQGTKAGHTAASAWTTMRLLGREGYLDVARRLHETTDKLVRGMAPLGITPLAQPEAGILVVTGSDVDIFAVSKGLFERGFPHCSVLQPEALHFVLNPLENDAPIDALLEAMSGAVADAKAGRITREGEQATYA